MNTTEATWLDPAMYRHLDRDQPADDQDTLFGLARSLVGTLWRWRLLILGIVVVGLAAAWLFVSTLPSTYVARASMFFDFSRQTVVSDLPADAVAPSTAMLNTEMEILSSRNLMGVVVDEFALIDDPEFNPWLVHGPDGTLDAGDDAFPPEEEIRQTAITILHNQVRVSLVPDTYVFTITVETLSPEKSAAIANGIADLFIRDRDDRRLAASEDAISWLERRTEALRQRVLEVERRVAEERALVAPGGESSLSSMAAQIASLREQQAEASASADRLATTADRIRSDLSEGNQVAAAKLALDAVSGQLAREIEAAVAMQPDASPIEEMDLLVEEARQQIADTAAASRAEAGALQDKVEGLRDIYASRSEEAQQLRDSEREAAASLVAYEAMLNRLKGRVAADSVDPFWPEAAVISPAVPPQQAASPNRELILALGGVGSMAVASALALLLNALLPVVQSARALERTTGIPVLARLPVPTLARPTKLMRHLRQNPSSPLADSFRTLRISIALGSKDRAPRVMLLTSADKGEGKSVTGYLLAQSLVQAGRRVLLIDADPSKQGLFGRQPAGPGLNSVLLGEVDAKEVIRRDETSGIDILIAPEALREDADILAYNEGTEGLDGIKSGYDVVVVLAPPVQQLPDAQVLASLANAVLVVVRRHRSRPDAVAATLRQLANAGAPRLAMVLLDRSA